MHRSVACDGYSGTMPDDRMTDEDSGPSHTKRASSTLRLAFVAFLPKRSVGVERTLREKALAFEEIGANVDVVVVNSWTDKVEGNLRYVRFAPRLPAFIRYPLTVFCRYRLIEKAVDLAPYDAVILRYPAADRSGPRFVSKLPVITEHHSRMLPEMLSYDLASVPPAQRILKRVRRRLERKYGGQILRNCRGIIAVTDEIRNDEQKRVAASVPAITVPNGIDVGSVRATGFVPFDGKELHIVYVASLDSPWSGLDRLTTGLRQYSGEVRILLHLVGDIPRSAVTAVETDRVTTAFHGVLSGAGLDSVMSNASIAVSSLGLHRKQMQEACNLRTREYVARGIPFIISHHDPDLDQVPKEDKFFLTVSADDSPIDITTVVDFARMITQDADRPSLAHFMREYAYAQLDWGPKMNQYVEFCKSSVGSA